MVAFAVALAWLSASADYSASPCVMTVLTWAA
jgi:hypothetical protein